MTDLERLIEALNIAISNNPGFTIFEIIESAMDIDSGAYISDGELIDAIIEWNI